MKEGSRRERKRARTRRQIFESACALFGRRGFDAVTIEQICSAADVARATFFLHFRSKAAVLAAWDLALASELSERLGERRGSALSEYRLIVDYLVDRWPRRGDTSSALLGALLSRGEGRAPSLCDVVEDVVRRGQRRGALRRNVSPKIAAFAVLATTAAALSGAAESEDGRRVANAEILRSELLHALLHGAAEPKPRVKWRP